MTTAMTMGLTTVQSHLDAFTEMEKTLPGRDRPGVARLRRAAIARFGEIGFPNERNEDWKFTSVAPLVRTPMQGSSVDDLVLPETEGLPPGVLVLGLREALARHPELVEAHLGQHASFKDHPFVALNTAFWNHGVFVYIPAGVMVEKPIELTYLASFVPAVSALPHLSYRRNLVVVGKGSQVRLVEEHTTAHDSRYAVNVVSEVILAEGAVVDHYKVQQESMQAFHLATAQAVVASKGNFSSHYVGLGGALVRNEVRVLFTGEHAEATVNGLYLLDDSQHADNHTVIDHAKPHCASHELYKGILDGKSRGVFNGKIFVRQDAQKTDAKQTNQTLLLSEEATINTKPQLEIFADDVKCTHGATVGQLDEEQLFYLRARGIGEEQARALLTFAFANDIIGRIQVPVLREKLERGLLEARHLPRLEESES